MRAPHRRRRGRRRTRRAERSTSADRDGVRNGTANDSTPTSWKSASTLPGSAGRTFIHSAGPPQSGSAKEWGSGNGPRATANPRAKVRVLPGALSSSESAYHAPLRLPGWWLQRSGDILGILLAIPAAIRRQPAGRGRGPERQRGRGAPNAATPPSAAAPPVSSTRGLTAARADTRPRSSALAGSATGTAATTTARADVPARVACRRRWSPAEKSRRLSGALASEAHGQRGQPAQAQVRTPAHLGRL